MEVVGLFDPRFEERCKVAETQVKFWRDRSDLLFHHTGELRRKIEAAELEIMRAQEETLDWRRRREPA